MLRVEINQRIEDPTEPIDLIVRKYHISSEDILSHQIVHRSLDARANRPAMYVYQIDLKLNNEARYAQRLKSHARSVTPYVYQKPVPGTEPMKNRPVEIGRASCRERV